MMLSRNFRAGFRIRLHQKDLRNVLQTGQELNVPVARYGPVAADARGVGQRGRAGIDHSALLKFVEGLAGIEVKAGG